MGKLARISLSTSKLRFGGGRFGRVARQAMRERADARETNRIILEALHRAGIDKVPDVREAFVAFFQGPLCALIAEKLGAEAAEQIRAEVEAGLKLVGASDSGVQPKMGRRPMRLVLVGVSPERAAAFEAEAGDHQVVHVRDVLDVMSTVTDRAPMAVVFDEAAQMIPAALRMLGKVLPPGTRVLQWGGQVVIDRPEAIAWERLDREASPLEVVGRCVRHAHDEGDPGAHTILVADDSDAWRASLTRRLTSEGYDVVGAADGLAALEACLEHLPSLVLSDYDMPGFNGAQLAQKIQQELGPKAPPLLLVTSAEVDARDLPGVIAVYPKRADLEKLLKRAQRLLKRRGTS